MIGIVIFMTPPIYKLDVKKDGAVHPGGLIALGCFICLIWNNFCALMTYGRRERFVIIF